MAIPWPMSTRARVMLEPSMRRVIAAPFTGVLDVVHVEGGDRVEEGALLIEMEGRETLARLAEVEARLASVELSLARELESSNYAEATARRLEVQGLQHERELLRYYRDHLQLRAPMTGVVIANDLQRTEGVSVELGRPLLEIAPLQQMIASIEVDERDIALVADGMAVEVQLSAYPGVRYRSELSMIARRAEVRDGRTVFLAEAAVVNDSGILRPGMRGKAVIRGHSMPLAWHLFRKPWQMLQRWMF